MLFFIIIMAAGILVDQLTKLYAVKVLSTYVTVPIIPKVFHLTFVKNTGAAFSLLSGKQVFLIIITCVLIIALVYAFVILPKKARFFDLNLALSLIISGAVGNLIDRIHYQYVVDFFDFRIIGFAIFNVADVLVVVGSILMVIVIWRNHFPSDASELNHPIKVKAKSTRQEGPNKSTSTSQPPEQREPLKARKKTKRKVADVPPAVKTHIESIDTTPANDSEEAPENVDFTPSPPLEIPAALRHNKK